MTKFNDPLVLNSKEHPYAIHCPGNPDGSCKVQQNLKDETDPNVIVARFIQNPNATIPRRDMVFGDVTRITDLSDLISMSRMIEADFASLDASVRAKFDNSALLYGEWLNDPENRERAANRKFDDLEVVVENGERILRAVAASGGSGKGSSDTEKPKA